MAKYMKLLMVALFAAMSFAFVSCGDDDDEPGAGGGSLSINGVKYRDANPTLSMDGSWADGNFTVAALDKDGAANYYTFYFTPSGTTAKVGDNFATMDLTVELLDCSDAVMSTLDYESGSVTVKSFGKNSIGIDVMTVEFKNLKMSGYTFMGNEPVTYTFNGTATVDFEK